MEYSARVVGGKDMMLPDCLAINPSDGKVVIWEQKSNKYGECSGLYRIIVTGTDIENRCQKISIESQVVINTAIESLIRG